MALPRTLAAFVAAAQLTLPDRRALALFDLSEAGFWHSFQALPWYVGALALTTLLGAPQVALSDVVLDALFDVVDFLAFPLLMIPVTRSLGLGEVYAPLVVATNWATALSAVLIGSLALGPALPNLVWDAVVIGLLAYQWNAIRIAMGTGGLMAAGVTILGVVLTLILHQAQDFVAG